MKFERTKIGAACIAASISPEGKKIFTMKWTYPRFIHGEVMTHRDLSRNAASSRAIPTAKMLAQVWNDPALPVYWGSNQPGMQAGPELVGWRLAAVKTLWNTAGRVVCGFVWAMNKLGLHKQIANRPLETWQWMHTIVTSTEWDNLEQLRIHPDAQPEFQALARVDKEVRSGAALTPLVGGSWEVSAWHLPFVTDKEKAMYGVEVLVPASAARCARVSYLTHDKANPDIQKDKALFDKLVGSVPMHASPIEHQAFPAPSVDYRSGNFKGFIQYRQVHVVPLAAKAA